MNKHKLNTIVRKAISTACRRITGRQKGGVVTRMVQTTSARCKIGVDPSVPTACWSWVKGMHRIKCGLSFHDMCNASTLASDTKMKKFVYQVIRHETEHGLQTDRTNAVAETCESGGIPFRLWNLFEDCRIEYNSATRTGGDGAFRWINFQDVDDEYSKPTALLWATKTNEAGIKAQPSASVPKWSGAEKVMYHGKSKKTRLVILDFYQRACSCATSMDLIPVCLEWINIFGIEVEDGIAPDSINGKVDPNAPKTDSLDDKSGQVNEDNAPSQNKNWNEWSTESSAMNEKQISRIARSLNQVIQSAKVTRNRLNCNGNKLDASQAMQGSEQAFRNRGRTNGKRSLVLIVDMSGSMNTTYNLDGGKEFILAFRHLARQQKLDLEILLTQNYGGAKSYRIRKDDSDEWINDLSPDGNGERIMDCMKRFETIIKRSTTSVIFTDACLNDSDINTQQYRNMGLNTIATYIEPISYRLKTGRKRMNEHFARSVIATNANELATRLMREILKD